MKSNTKDRIAADRQFAWNLISIIFLPFSREEDICHVFASHAMKDVLPNSVCIIGINKWRYRLGISNIVQGIWTERYMLQGIVLVYVVDDFQQTIFVPSKSWQTCKMVLIWWFHIHPCQFLHLHIVPVMYVESRKMARWSSSTNTFTMIKAISRFNHSHHAMPSAQIQWQSSSRAGTSVSVPMFKVCGVHGFVQNCRAFQGTGSQI